MATQEVIRITNPITTLTIDQVIKDGDSIPVIQEKEISTDTFLDKCNGLFGHVNDDPFILPRKCRFSKKYTPKEDSQAFLFIIEEEPTVRTIRVNLPMEAPIERLRKEGNLERFGYENFELKLSGDPYFFRLSFPYVIHVLLLTLSVEQTPTFTHWVFYRLAPLKSTFDYLLRPNLCNIDGAYKVCPGDYKIKETRIPDMVDEYLHHFWSSIFNKDYSTHYMYYDEDEFICDFLHWQHYSATDPSFFFNVDWVDIEKPLNEIIEKAEQHHNLRTFSYFSLETLTQFIESPNLVHRNVKPNVSFSNWVDSLWLDTIQLSIGDKIQIRNKVFYIKEFLKVSRISYILVEDINGKEYKLRDTYKLREVLARTLLKDRKEINITVDNVTYSIGDLIVIESPPSFRGYAKIASILRNRAGKIILVVDNGRKYILDNIKIQKFNEKEIIINGQVLKSEDKILLLSKRSTSNYFATYEEAIFKRVVFDYGALSYDFAKSDPYYGGRMRTQRINDYQMKEWSFLQVNSANYTIVPYLVLSGRLYKTPGNFLLYNGQAYVRNVHNFEFGTFDEIKTFVTENQISFPFLKSFNVGDRICIALWDEPNEMLKLRQITRFIIDDTQKKVLVETNDGTNIRQDPIVIDNKILYASFRHIETEYKGLNSGMVIKPKRIGISCFPKKSNYRIIGFIHVNFTPVPMVLMSNCCTLWPFQIVEDFELTNDINVEEPDISKIKVQDHDLLSLDSGQYGDHILLYEQRFAGLRIYDIFGILGTEAGSALTTLPKASKRIGFIYPRLDPNADMLVKYYGFVDGQGNVMFRNDDLARFRFSFDKRVFNV